MLFLFSITWGNVSGWWLPVCVLAGLLYAWVMYRRPLNISNYFRYLLFALRAITVTLLGLLLVSPLVQTVNYKPEKPLVLVLQDNSQSLVQPGAKNEGLKVTDDLTQLKTKLGADYDVQEFHFDHSLHSGLSKTFNGRQTDISSALKQLNDRFVNRNVGAVVLATDGIYNRGANPQYEAKNVNASIYTIPLGDTIPKRDMLIGSIGYNKTVFTGNDFIIEVLAEAYQSNGEQLRLSVSEAGQTLYSKSFGVNSKDYKKVIPVTLTAGKKGLHKFKVSIAPVNNELTIENNTEDIYVDVLDARQKVLLIYQNVHPDIGVIRNAIESNRNYEVKAVLLSELVSLKLADYNLVILFQTTGGASAGLKDYLQKSGVPVWYTVGAQGSMQAFNDSQKGIRISADGTEMQEVFAAPDDSFTAFTLSDSTRQKLTRMPPLLAPFGNYTASANTAVLLKQRIGNVNTTYPLLAFSNTGGQRLAVLTGEGLWRWKLAEYNNYGSHKAIEELLSQSVQYLTANANQQQFRLYPAKTVFDEGENVLLNAELYNDALELVNTPDIKIDIKSNGGKSYNFLFSRTAQAYNLDAGALPSGEYSYTATTKLGDKALNANGRFTVKQLNLEARQTTANHAVLREIANQSGGMVLYPSQVSQLADMIRKNENIKTIVYEDKHYADLVDIKWVFVLILTLLSTEWFLRKREGEV